MGAKRQQDIVQVQDPKGRVHNMSRPNALDLIAHCGWLLIFNAPSVDSNARKGVKVTAEQMELATSPRTLRPREDHRDVEQTAPTSVHVQAAKVPHVPSVEGADPDEEQAAEAALKPKRVPRGRPAKTKDEEFADGEKALGAVIPAVMARSEADELADLEGDEDARAPKDE